MSDFLNQASALHQSGRLQQAESAYRQLLSVQPDNIDALHLLGILTHQTGRSAEAVHLLNRALAVQPASGILHNSLGNILRDCGRLEEAAASYRAALKTQPNMPEIHRHLGLTLHSLGRMEQAEAALRSALRLKRDFVPARIDLGNLLVATGNFRDAEACLRAALRTEPSNAQVHNGLGLALVALGRHEDALACFEAALAASPTYAIAAANRAQALMTLERLDESADAFMQSLQLAPNDFTARLALGDVLLKLERPADAWAHLQLAAQLQPHSSDAARMCGVALHKLGRADEALTYFAEATRLQPEDGEVFHQHGIALRDLGRWDEALACFAESARLRPENAEARASFSYVLLSLGHFAEGFAEFEWRMRKAGNVKLAEPIWDGQDTDKTVLIHAEQGIGDTIQFCRFLPMAAGRARVIFVVRPAMTRLVSDLPGIAQIVDGEPVPPYDVQCPIMSLPYVLGIPAESFANGVPYFYPDALRLAQWREKLAGLPGCKVGLVWAGNPKFPADAERSISLDRLAPVLAVPNISFISLQLGDAAAGAAEKMLDISQDLSDLTDTAALIAALDLVIAVDTAVAHLAGALGKRVWMLNRANTDWRWQVGHEDSYWYPTMRIFWQDRPGDWSAPIARVAAALAKFIASPA